MVSARNPTATNCGLAPRRGTMRCRSFKCQALFVTSVEWNGSIDDVGLDRQLEGI